MTSEQLEFGNRLREKPKPPAGFFIYNPATKKFYSGPSDRFCSSSAPKYYLTLGLLKASLAQSIWRDYTKRVWKINDILAKCEVWKIHPEMGVVFVGDVIDFQKDYIFRHNDRYNYTEIHIYPFDKQNLANLSEIIPIPTESPLPNDKKSS